VMKQEVYHLPRYSWLRSSSEFQLDGETGTIQSLCDTLYHTLVRPIENHLNSNETKGIVIVPFRDMIGIPWSMFLSRPFVIIPSLPIWDRLDQRIEPARENPHILVLNQAPRDEAGHARDLPYSRIEGPHVASQHGHFPELTDDLDHWSAHDLMNAAQVIHICGVAYSDSADLDLPSSIQVGKEPWVSHELGAIKTKANILISSGSNSALTTSLDALYSLFASGTRAFIVPLWPVDDGATLLFMMILFKELRRPGPPVEALFNTKERMRAIDRPHVGVLIEQLKAMFKELGPTKRKYVNAPSF
jgi:CHAT domain-containing protein